jgi:hypothetical protein
MSRLPSKDTAVVRETLIKSPVAPTSLVDWALANPPPIPQFVPSNFVTQPESSRQKEDSRLHRLGKLQQGNQKQPDS